MRKSSICILCMFLFVACGTPKTTTTAVANVNADAAVKKDSTKASVRKTVAFEEYAPTKKPAPENE